MKQCRLVSSLFLVFLFVIGVVICCDQQVRQLRCHARSSVYSHLLTRLTCVDGTRMLYFDLSAVPTQPPNRPFLSPGHTRPSSDLGGLVAA